MNLTGIESLGYSRFDWELAKRKEKDPDVKFEDILKEEMEQLDRRSVMYKSPIEKIYGEMQSQMIKQDEMNMMLSVNQAVGYEVDKDELQKALSYDRNQYQKGYDDAMQKMRWIPTSERQPEENGNYLAFYRSGDETATLEFMMVDHCNAGGGWLHEESRRKSYKKVIAWMPLPDPYKAESEGKE